MNRSQTGHEKRPEGRNRDAGKKDGRKRNGVIYLLIAIPVASLLMGAVTLFVAFQHGDPAIDTRHAPLSKTSWQQADEQ